MAGWASFKSSIIIFIILSLLIKNLSEDTSNDTNNKNRGNVEIFVAARDTCRVKIASLASKPNDRCFKKWEILTTKKKCVLAIRLLNNCLAASLTLLCNDVDQNPGPDQVNVSEMQGLRIIHLNVCSLRNKMAEIRLLCDKHKPHILSLNETWLDGSFPDNQVSLVGYNLIRQDRDCYGGGLAVYVTESLDFERLAIDADNTTIYSDIEAIWIELKPSKGKNILIGAFYRPPNFDATIFIEKLDEMLRAFARDDIEMVLLGDFNFNLACSASLNTLTRSFLRTTRRFCLQQLIKKPTRVTESSKTLIDLMFTTRPQLYCSGVFPVGFTDHFAIFGVRKLHRVKLPPPKFIRARNYKHYDANLFKSDISHIPWDIIEMENDSELAWNIFKDMFMTVADKHAPIIEKRVRGKSLPWITHCIKDLMRQRDYHHRKALSTNEERHWSTYRRLRNTVTAKLRKEKEDYYRTQLTGKIESKDMWKTVNELLCKTKSHGSGTNCGDLTAKKFSQFFSTIAAKLCKIFGSVSSMPRILSPRILKDFVIQEATITFVQAELNKIKQSKAIGLDGITARLLKDAGPVLAKPITYIINLTITTGQIPCDWKEAKVIPIYKQGKKNDVNNYRPISVLPLISKVMERTIQIQLLNFIKENNILSTHQSGFRKQHSTETTVVSLVDKILENMDKQRITGAVFIDLKKAFDLVDLDCLLYKLEHYGIRGNSLSWFQNYLATRSQRVKFGQDLSDSLSTDHGVPQGSILGPLLFILYINDLPMCLNDCSISMYADDTMIYYSDKSTVEIREILQNDFNRLVTWLEHNRLVLSETKTKTMLFGTKKKVDAAQDLNIYLHGQNIEQVAQFTYLGVVLDKHLNWKDHVEAMSVKIGTRLKMLTRIRSYLTLEAMKAVYNGLILPIFDYCDVAWAQLSEGCSQELQRLQNQAARVVLKRTSSVDTFNVLNWISLERRREMHVCIFVFKCLNDLFPSNIRELLTQNHNIHKYNTRKKNDLHLPKIKRELGKRTFRFNGPVQYNKLPIRVKEATSLLSFKTQIWNYLCN